MNGLGLRIRNVRKARGLVLQQVADATHLTVGFLSQVERDIAVPSISSLALIASALDASIETFVPPPEPVPRVSRDGRRPAFSIDPQSVAYERLSTDFPGRTLSALKVRVPPAYTSETSAHAGEEIVYVLSGSIRYVIGGETHDLDAGDCLHFAAEHPHRVENVGKETSELLSIGTLDIFHGIQSRNPPTAIKRPGRRAKLKKGDET
jgi:transcriptional regulator with XRE-family HTH domain